MAVVALVLGAASIADPRVPVAAEPYESAEYRPFEEATVAMGNPEMRQPMLVELRPQGPGPDEVRSISADLAPLPRQASRWWIAAVVWSSGTCATAIWIFVATARLHRRVRGDCAAATQSIERRDHWMQGLQLLALCAHWFNPLVWLGFRFLRADRELAADE